MKKEIYNGMIKNIHPIDLSYKTKTSIKSIRFLINLRIEKGLDKYEDKFNNYLNRINEILEEDEEYGYQKTIINKKVKRIEQYLIRHEFKGVPLRGLEEHVGMSPQSIKRIVYKYMPEFIEIIKDYNKRCKDELIIELIKQRKEVEEIKRIGKLGQLGKVFNYIKELSSEKKISYNDVMYYYKKEIEIKNAKRKEFTKKKQDLILGLISEGRSIEDLTKSGKFIQKGKTISYLISLEEKGVIDELTLKNYVKKFRQERKSNYYHFKGSNKKVLERLEKES